MTSIMITILTISLPFILAGLALLIAVIRADRKDLPRMIHSLAQALSGRGQTRRPRVGIERPRRRELVTG